MNEIRFYHDTDGAPRAESGSPALASLAQFLESDIQDDRSTCIDLLGELMSMRKGARPFEFIGNSWLLSYSQEFAALASHADEDAEAVPLPPQTIREAVREWLEFIG
jgi:hypothetical protein